MMQSIKYRLMIHLMNRFVSVVHLLVSVVHLLVSVVHSLVSVVHSLVSVLLTVQTDRVSVRRQWAMVALFVLS